MQYNKLTYEELRLIAKDGDVFFLHVDKKNILSHTTAFFTKSPLTHAAFLFWYKDRLLVCESTTHGGSRIATLSHYYDRLFEHVSAPVTWQSIEQKALERSGTADYGWLSATYIGIREFMLTHFGIRLPQDKSNKNKACSEFVSELLELEDTDISPGALYKKLMEK